LRVRQAAKRPIDEVHRRAPTTHTFLELGQDGSGKPEVTGPALDLTKVLFDRHRDGNHVTRTFFQGPKYQLD
jgi:hypothetical protein